MTKKFSIIIVLGDLAQNSPFNLETADLYNDINIWSINTCRTKIKWAWYKEFLSNIKVLRMF